ncbi:MAG: MoaD/ThiS family protein [Deltaproteobacteria bacterium]|nr:MoaD/ThiS family protein [Deltaproteobacteria bacterium]
MSELPSTDCSIKVVYSGLLQQTFGLTEETIAIGAGSTARDLLLLLANKHGDWFREGMFVGQGQLVPNAIVLVDGRDIRHRRGMDTAIGAPRSVEILLLPPATGGG